MRSAVPPNRLTRLGTVTVLLLAVVGSGAFGQAASAACRAKCAPLLTAADSCCARHVASPADLPASDGNPDEQQSQPCPVACPGCCPLRILSVPPTAVTVTGQPELQLVASALAVTATAVDVPFSIFHPPRA